MMNEGLSASDIAVLTGNTGGNNRGGMWGDDGWMWLIVLFLFAGGGWGGGFGGWGGGGANSPGLQGIATRADINEGFALNDIQNGIRGIQQGICDSTYALNNSITGGFHDATVGMMQGFNGVQSQLCQMSAAQQACCCETGRAIERGFADTNYNLATQVNGIQQSLCGVTNTIQNTTRDVLENANNNTRAILDFLTQDKIATLTAENQALKFQASQTAQNAFITANQEAQTATLLRRLGADCPTPAYVVQPPTPVSFPTNGCGQVQFGGYGCGCSA